MFRLFLALLLSIALTGCDRDTDDNAIVSYRAPKDQPATQPAAPTTAPSMISSPLAAGLRAAPTSQGELKWKLPPGWTEAPSAGDSQMRFAAFRVSADDPTLQVTLIPLGAEASELLPNIARWQGQIGMPASKTDDEAKQFVQVVNVDGVPVNMVDLTSPQLSAQRQRILAAIVPLPSKTWFVKLQGATEKVSTHAEEFLAFVKSLQFSRENSSTATDPAIDPTNTAKAQASGEPNWTVPDGWILEAAKPMRVATFTTSSDSTHAAQIIITRFATVGMSDRLGNINRWRGMLDLKPVANEIEQPAKVIEVGHGAADEYEFAAEPDATGQAAGQKMVVVTIPADDQTWYIRFVGPAAEIDAQRTKFDGFLKSIKW